MAQAELQVSERHVMGKKVKALRRQGVVPGTISGHGVAPIQVQVNEHDLDAFLAHRRGTELVTLSGLGGQPLTVLVRAVDRVPTTGRVQHIEFQQVQQREKLHVDVPLQFTGTAPAAARDRGTLLTALNHVRVESYPGDLPAALGVDLGALTDFDAAIHVRDIHAPSGVTVLTPGDELVAKVVPSRIEAEVEEEAAAAAAAAPAPAEAPAATEAPAEEQSQA